MDRSAYLLIAAAVLIPPQLAAASVPCTGVAHQRRTAAAAAFARPTGAAGMASCEKHSHSISGPWWGGIGSLAARGERCAGFGLRPRVGVPCVSPSLQPRPLSYSDSFTALASWQIVNTGYPTDDTVVVAKVMTPDLLPTDPAEKDCSKAFNDAFKEVSREGGGFVYAPEGTYLFTKPLILQQNVVLRGAWGSVSGSNKSVRGTVLKVTYNGRFDKKDKPFVQLTPRAGLQDLSIWYPKQSLDSVIKYAATIGGNVDKPDEAIIRNVNLVNSYVGLQASGNWKRTYCNGLYGSPLNLGMFQESSSDVPFYSQVSFSAEYWAESGLPRAPSAKDLKNYLRDKATGIKIEGSDNIFASEWSVDSYKDGLRFQEGSTGVVNGNMYGFRITNCKTALRADDVGPTFFIKSVFDATGDAVRLKKVSGSVGLLFNECSFRSTKGSNAFNSQVDVSGAKTLNFQNCKFDGRLIAGASRLSVANCEFSYDSGKPVRLAKNTDVALLAGNSFEFDGNPVDLNGADKDILKVDKNPTFSKSLTPFDIDGYDKTRKPYKQNMIVIGEKGYKVEVDGNTDDAPVIQKAMDDIRSQGGGIVLVPQISEEGYAIRSRLNIPEGVELRSSSEGLHSFNGRGKGERIPGAFLQVYHGRKGSAPTINMNKGSGFKGFTVHYPQQKMNSITPYAVTIRVKGDGAYVLNNQFLNSYRLIELVKSDDHLVENNMIQHVDDTITIKKCKNGRFNHNFIRDEWGDSRLPTAGDENRIIEYSLKNNIAYKVIGCQDQQLFASFGRKSKWIGRFTDSSILSLQFSMEGCQSAIDIDGIPKGKSVELIGSSLRTDSDKDTNIKPLTMFDVATDESDGDFKVFSTLCSGFPATLMKISDADFLFQNSFVRLDDEPSKITLSGSEAGVSRIESSAIRRDKVFGTIKNAPGKRLEVVASDFFAALDLSVRDSQISDTVDPDDLSPSIRLSEVASENVQT